DAPGRSADALVRAAAPGADRGHRRAARGRRLRRLLGPAPARFTAGGVGLAPVPRDHLTRSARCPVLRGHRPFRGTAGAAAAVLGRPADPPGAPRVLAGPREPLPRPDRVPAHRRGHLDAAPAAALIAPPPVRPPGTPRRGPQASSIG